MTALTFQLCQRQTLSRSQAALSLNLSWHREVGRIARPSVGGVREHALHFLCFWSCAVTGMCAYCRVVHLVDGMGCGRCASVLLKCMGMYPANQGVLCGLLPCPLDIRLS